MPANPWPNTTAVRRSSAGAPISPAWVRASWAAVSAKTAKGSSEWPMRRPSAFSRGAMTSPSIRAASVVWAGGPWAPGLKRCGAMAPRPSLAALQVSATPWPSPHTAPRPVTTMRREPSITRLSPMLFDRRFEDIEKFAEVGDVAQGVFGDLHAVFLFDGEDHAD